MSLFLAGEQHFLWLRAPHGGALQEHLSGYFLLQECVECAQWSSCAGGFPQYPAPRLQKHWAKSTFPLETQSI